MKAQKIFLAITLIASIPSYPVSAVQENLMLPDLDGVVWERTSETLKTGYIAGFLCGFDLVYNQITIFDAAYAQKPYLARLNLAKISVGQILQGVDSFYKDFSNKRVKIIDAIYVAKMQIEGASQELIDAQIRYLKMQPISFEVSDKARQEWVDYNMQNGQPPTYAEMKRGDFSLEVALRIGCVITSDDKIHILFCYGDYQ